MELTAIVNPTTSSKYIRDFESLFVPIQEDRLRLKARTGLLRHCQYRSLCWRYFLHCLPKKQDQWLESCAKSRKLYEEIKSKHLPDQLDNDSTQSLNVTPSPPAPATPIADVAGKSKDETSVSREQSISDEIAKTTSTMFKAEKSREIEEEQQYIKATNECDYMSVFRTIERDVVRTFPDMEFFRQTEMQSILKNVLFNYASENPHLSYKQGMHELLATLLYVLHTDSQNCLINYEGGYANETIATLLDLKYLEHDVFHLFCALMKSIETWYQNDELLITTLDTTTRHGRGHSSKSSGRQQVGSVLGNKLRKISENIVKNYDIELFNHLEALQIAPQIYGIRWMRLLFGREFEFLDLLTVWDAIICDHVSMSLTDYIFASMLLTIREELVDGDYTDCLNNLMRHQFKDVQYVIKLALHLRDPINNDRPRSLQYDSQKHYSHKLPNIRSTPISSLTNKLSQQYISSRQQLLTSNRIHHLTSKKSAKHHSYDDLHSIVDYCWRLLSEQIDSLQRCLPKEKGLHSEDEIFVALAQLKKVRDVLKGSLKLEDTRIEQNMIKK